MKKNTIFLLLLMLSISALAQGVRTNGFDRFLKRQRIEMEPVVVTGLTDKNELALNFSAIESSLFLTLSGKGWGASTVDKANDLLLFFSDGSSRALKASSLQSFEPGPMQNAYRHQYTLGVDDLDYLSRLTLVSIRKYSFDTYSDLTIPKENSDPIKRLSAQFKSEVTKLDLAKAVRRIDAKNIRDYIGDSVVFCSKVYRTRYFQGSEDGPTLLDVQAKFSDPFINVIIPEKERSKFTGAPENYYLNKDVCISGVVRLQNNLPFIVIRNKEQLKETSLQETLPTIAATEETATEKLAEFPGGANAFLSYLEKSLVTTARSKESKLVVASFAIDAQGNCSGIKIVESGGPSVDEEVKRVLLKMPKWKPAFSNGQFVASRITQPIRIKGTGISPVNN